MWKSININKQQVETETFKAMLIKMPNNSSYKGFCFWHPKKLIREGRRKNALSLSYTDEFVFKISKKSNGKIIEDAINVDMFEEAFDVIDSNIVSPKKESYLIVKEPEKINKTVEVVECLKNSK